MLLDHERSRLAALRSYDVLDSPREVDFDRITTMSTRLFDVALACITLVDKDRFFFKSTFGVDVRNLDRQPGFCDTVIQQEGVYCIEDTATEPLVQNHPLVINAPHIKSYAGSPLRTCDGFAIGTLCIMDPEARVFTDADKLLLQELSEFVMFHLDRRRLRAEADRHEQEKRDVQKLESLGMLAGGIAHDFNNLLVGVLGNASLAASQIDVDSPAQSTITSIVRAANQASEMTDQLLAYAGQRPTRPKPVDIAELVGNMSALIKSTIAKDVTFVVEHDDSLPAAIGDPTQLRQIILNLISNASDAYYGNTGAVHIGISQVILGRPGTGERYSSDLAAGPYVRIEVEDFGCGMDSDTLNSMFSPFFSTKVSGRGLGMSIVQRIVRGHGGHIQVESVLGQGCKVCVLLPADSAPGNSVPDKAHTIAKPIGGKGTVLVVDDEELIINMTTKALKSFGFDVCSAADGKHALEKIESLDVVDALILDATMPGMNGTSTLNAVRKHRPGLPTVITSGHHIDEVASQFQTLEEITFLHKPWTLEQLSEALEQAISGSTAAVRSAAG